MPSIMSDLPKISVIIIAYNMPRELPRTIQSFSTKMQKWIKAEDYEIIVVDNGSYEPFDEALCQSHANNISFIYMDNPTQSPCPAVNKGIAAANGEIIGVCIDGARMASPGLLRMVLDASRVSNNAVIGSLGFHLGQEVQMQAVHNGYNQSEEDELLKTVPWQENGYRLFDISVPAGSSRFGWFEMPAECNALFMHRALWNDLEGYDEAFTSKAGGLSNHDVWSRAGALKDAQVMLLLGEGTFHQFHGGAATNSKVPTFKKYQAEYERIRGHKFERLKGTPISFGRLNNWAKQIKWS